jgi:hypothetical protein
MPRKKGASGSNREAESTDAPGRGGLLRSSDEAGVIPLERRERGHRHLAWVNRQREEPDVQWKAAAFARWCEPDDATVGASQNLRPHDDFYQSDRLLGLEIKEASLVRITSAVPLSLEHLASHFPLLPLALLLRRHAEIEIPSIPLD